MMPLFHYMMIKSIYFLTMLEMLKLQSRWTSQCSKMGRNLLLQRWDEKNTNELSLVWNKSHLWLQYFLLFKKCLSILGGNSIVYTVSKQCHIKSVYFMSAFTCFCLFETNAHEKNSLSFCELTGLLARDDKIWSWYLAS